MVDRFFWNGLRISEQFSHLFSIQIIVNSGSGNFVNNFAGIPDSPLNLIDFWLI